MRQITKTGNADLVEYSYTLDLYSKIPYMDMPEEERSEIWGDGLHFTTKGYDVMGNIIAEKIIELVTSELKGPEEVEGVKDRQKDEETKKKTYRLEDSRDSESSRERKLLRSGRVL